VRGAGQAAQLRDLQLLLALARSMSESRMATVNGPPLPPHCSSVDALFSQHSVSRPAAAVPSATMHRSNGTRRPVGTQLVSSQPAVTSSAADGAAGSDATNTRKGRQQARKRGKRNQAHSSAGDSKAVVQSHSQQSQLLQHETIAPHPCTREPPAPRVQQSVLPPAQTASSVPAEAQAAVEQQAEIPSCVICTEPMEVVAIGTCGHAATCARCCLKTRLNYSNNKCPVCAVQQPLVIIVPWSQKLPAPPEATAAGKPVQGLFRQYHYHAPWAQGVLVAKTEPYVPFAATRKDVC
jgi:hypothetical protein